MVQDLCVFRFDEVDRFTRIYVGTRYSALFGSEKYDAIYYKFKCLISVKSLNVL